jgi:hypothetical protein
MVAQEVAVLGVELLAAARAWQPSAGQARAAYREPESLTDLNLPQELPPGQRRFCFASISSCRRSREPALVQG